MYPNISISTNPSKWNRIPCYPISRQCLLHGSWSEQNGTCVVTSTTMEDLPQLNTNRLNTSLSVHGLSNSTAEYGNTHLFMQRFFEEASKKGLIDLKNVDMISSNGSIEALIDCVDPNAVHTVTAKRVIINGKEVISLSQEYDDSIQDEYRQFGTCFEEYMTTEKEFPIHVQKRAGQNYVISELSLGNLRCLIRSEVDCAESTNGHLVEIKCTNYIKNKTHRKAYLASIEKVVYSGIKPKHVNGNANATIPKIDDVKRLIGNDLKFGRGLQRTHMVCTQLIDLFSASNDLMEIKVVKKYRCDITYEEVMS
ncbi:hypothetical protein QR680_014357 [Steinernema hermaphroditum]|uniref:Decapping nuclease n=1 Tax=Steinernema hermaphroditum TaxID=289476 RepID=A0AA39M3X8_9BILA|nr:hypothetical protein QR680_014357 [Steinernema hermaphroditum]